MAALCPRCGCRDMDRAYGYWYCFSCNNYWREPADAEALFMWWVGFIGSVATVALLVGIMVAMIR